MNILFSTLSDGVDSDNIIQLCCNICSEAPHAQQVQPTEETVVGILGAVITVCLLYLKTYFIDDSFFSVTTLHSEDSLSCVLDATVVVLVAGDSSSSKVVASKESEAV
jgi:hypothetical protein